MTACCYLAGTIPKELGQLPKLQVMLLQMNMHEGSIPAELGILANLTTFNAAFNRLSGSIPAMAGATYLKTFSVAHNKLTGELPAELLSLPNLQASTASCK
jgi:hypothetical protein